MKTKRPPNNRQLNSWEDREYRYGQGVFAGTDEDNDDNLEIPRPSRNSRMASKAANALKKSRCQELALNFRERHKYICQELMSHAVCTGRGNVKLHDYQGPATVRRFEDLSIMAEPENGNNPYALHRIADKQEAGRLLAQGNPAVRA